MVDRSIPSPSSLPPQPEAAGPIMSYLEQQVMASINRLTDEVGKLKEHIIRQNGRIKTVETGVAKVEANCAAQTAIKREQGLAIARLQTTADLTQKHATERTELIRDDISEGKGVDREQDKRARTIAEKVWANSAKIGIYGLLILYVLKEVFHVI